MGDSCIFIPTPSLERGQHCLLSSALLQHPVRAVNLRALRNFYTRMTVYLLHLPRAGPSKGLSIIQHYGRVSAYIFKRLDVIKHSDMSLYTPGKKTMRGKACSFWHGMLRAQLWLETWSREFVLWQPRL